MTEWGDGKSTAETAEEAEVLWQAAKKREKAAMKYANRNDFLSSQFVFGLERMKNLASDHSSSFCIVSYLLLGFATGMFLAKK